jgi:hypothetical protein
MRKPDPMTVKRGVVGAARRQRAPITCGHPHGHGAEAQVAAAVARARRRRRKGRRTGGLGAPRGIEGARGPGEH